MKLIKPIILFTVSVILIGMISTKFSSHFLDITQNQSHQLSSTTISLLKSLDQPLDITLVTQNDDLKRDVEFFTKAISQIKTVSLTHQPSSLAPEQADKYGFTHDGLIFHYLERSKGINLKLSPLDELTFVKTLFKLVRDQQQWLVFVEGHGEPSIHDASSKGYELLAKALAQQELKVQSLNLPKTGFIPDNTSLLVVTSPRGEYLPREISTVKEYIKQGGALLWLMDYQGKPLSFLSHLLGMRPHDGIILDQHGTHMGTPHPAITIVTDYNHALLGDNQQLTAYPWAQALMSEPRAAFTKSLLLETNKSTWTHKGPIEGTILFEPDKGDISGPLALGYRLERKIEDKSTQQIIVIGNHRFATNAAIQNYGNLSLSLSLVNHLLDENHLSQIDYQTPKDIIAYYPSAYHYFLTYGFMILLPGCILLFGRRYRMR